MTRRGGHICCSYSSLWFPWPRRTHHYCARVCVFCYLGVYSNVNYPLKSGVQFLN